jgi:hypothetical protein
VAAEGTTADTREAVAAKINVDKPLGFQLRPGMTLLLPACYRHPKHPSPSKKKDPREFRRQYEQQ